MKAQEIETDGWDGQLGSGEREIGSVVGSQPLF